VKFEKRNFMGIELDVLVGHPEHDLLFIANQVARAAGLKNPSDAIYSVRKLKDFGSVALLGDLPSDGLGENWPVMANGNRYIRSAAMFSEGQAYTMLLRGHAPQSEPFRKWVTEEVLPSIRKTGKYNANEAQDKELANTHI